MHDSLEGCGGGPRVGTGINENLFARACFIH
jgi:hypothetical protein